uniref:Uncharacterized protein n=1 Tax=Nelumbo nucifera TaxID=4432 RepID=A0A822ZK30_NELNU|nr:TPA_asm: hypothetical protein HUJ06_003732 [Nelumbo nucifera]
MGDTSPTLFYSMGYVLELVIASTLVFPLFHIFPCHLTFFICLPPRQYNIFSN